MHTFYITCFMPLSADRVTLNSAAKSPPHWASMTVKSYKNPTSLCERKLRRKIEPSKNLSQSNRIENFLKQVFVYHESWSMIGANHLHNYFDWIIVLEQKSFKPDHNLHCKLNLFDFSKWNWVQKLKKIYHLMAWEMSLKMASEML